MVDSFNFMQFISNPTHEQGHILDLVLSLGLPICNVDVLDYGLSDHMPVILMLVCHANQLWHSQVCFVLVLLRHPRR